MRVPGEGGAETQVLFGAPARTRDYLLFRNPFSMNVSERLGGRREEEQLSPKCTLSHSRKQLEKYLGLEGMWREVRGKES